MRSVKLTMAKILMVLFVACGLQMSASAQENSPYSRYGLGDLTPNHNIFTRGMGGIAAGVADNLSNGAISPNLGVNFTNPASLAGLSNTVFDVGVDINYRTLKSTSPAQKFTSANTYVSYLQLAFPLTTPKMAKKDMFWGMSLGLKPLTKINYKIEQGERRVDIDSIHRLFEGSGGVNQAFLGTGFKIKNFSIGINAGFMFGSKNNSTVVTVVPDSALNFYYTSNSATKTSIGGFFINGGMQYELPLAHDAKDANIVTKLLRIGVYGNLQQKLTGSSDKVRETIFYDDNGGFIRIDSVYEENDVKGKIKYPATVGLGLVYQDANWMYGFDVDYSNWSSYRYYGQTDAVQNSFTVRAGAQYYPYKLGSQSLKYTKHIKYRAGLYYGSDYINTAKNRPEYGVTLGAGLPLTSLRRKSYPWQYAVLNTAVEFGNRGNKQTNLRESLMRFSIGISMNAAWFQKPKYN